MKKLETINKVLAFQLIFFLFIYLSEILHQNIGEKLIIIGPCILLVLGEINIFIYSLQKIIDVLTQSLAKRVMKEWEDAKNNIRRNVVHFMEVNKEKMSSSVIRQLMVTFCEDDEIFKIFVNEIKRKYETDTKNQAYFSYFLLENYAHNGVLLLFEEDKEFKNQCEEFSKDICKKTIKDFYGEKIDEKIEKRFNELLIGILHCCVLNNYVDTEKFIFIVKSILTWIDSIAKEGKIILYQDSVASFMLIFPVIKEKLVKINKYTKDIEAGFSNFESTKWFKQILKISYNEVLRCANGDKISFSQVTGGHEYLGLMSIYYDKLCFWEQRRLLNVFIKRNQHISKYIELDDEKVIVYILSAAFMRTFKSECDLPYKVASLVNLYADELVSLV